MSRCVQCRALLGGEATLCFHHQAIVQPDWAELNRLMCDLLHRGRPPAPLAGGLAARAAVRGEPSAEGRSPAASGRGTA